MLISSVKIVGLILTSKFIKVVMLKKFVLEKRVTLYFTKLRKEFYLVIM